MWKEALDAGIVELSPYLTALFVAIVGLLTRAVIKAVKIVETKVSQWLDSKLSESQRELLHKIGQEAFSYAETVFKERGGEEKLAKAVDYLTQEAKKYGIDLSYEQLRAIIEKAVLDYNSKTKGIEGETLDTING